ncbi:MAG: PEP-CTERM sorting domain-containing protein [Pyrinomonadaceae bacterium]
MDFGGSANRVAFDNITLGSEVPGGGDPIPEPASMILLGTGLAGVIGKKFGDGVKPGKPNKHNYCISRTKKMAQVARTCAILNLMRTPTELKAPAHSAY